MALVLQLAQTEQLHRTQIMEYGEHRLLWTSNPTKRLMSWHLIFWITRRMAGKKTPDEGQCTHLRLVSSFLYEEGPCKVLACKQIYLSSEGGWPSGCCRSELCTHCCWAPWLHCHQQHRCHQVPSRALCYQLRTSQAGLQKRQLI